MLHGWKEDSMLVKRTAAYPTIYELARYWSELIATFSYPLHLTLEFREKVWSSENRNHGATRQWRQFDDGLSCFDTIPTACDGQTDVWTDVQPISITCAKWLTHVKNCNKLSKQLRRWSSGVTTAGWGKGVTCHKPTLQDQLLGWGKIK